VTQPIAAPFRWASSGPVGAASELRACAHLIDAGYYVYRCESPSAPFDLVAYRHGACLRVEVKTLSMKDHQDHAPSFGWPRNDEWDLLIIVGRADVFQFTPDTPKWQARDAIRVHLGYSALGPDPAAGYRIARSARFDSPGLGAGPCITTPAAP